MIPAKPINWHDYIGSFSVIINYAIKYSEFYRINLYFTYTINFNPEKWQTFESKTIQLSNKCLMDIVKINFKMKFIVDELIV